MNEQLLLNQIRQLGLCSRADLARLSGLSKPTVSLALANVERSGLVRTAGQRTGVPGRSAVLYEIRPEAGYVLGLDIGHEYLRGAIADLTGEIRAKAESRCPAASVSKRVSELVRLADGICSAAGVDQGRGHSDGARQPGCLRPHARRHHADRRAGRLGPAGGAGRPARRVRREPGRGERHRRRCARRAGARSRPGVPQFRVRLDRDRHRDGPGARRSAAPGGARGRGRDRVPADRRGSGRRRRRRRGPPARHAGGGRLGGRDRAGRPAGRPAHPVGAPGLRRGRGR